MADRQHDHRPHRGGRGQRQILAPGELLDFLFPGHPSQARIGSRRDTPMACAYRAPWIITEITLHAAQTAKASAAAPVTSPTVMISRMMFLRDMIIRKRESNCFHMKGLIP